MENNNRSSHQKGAAKVYVSNIDYATTYQDVKELFAKVGKIAFVEMLKDNNNKPNGCSVVTFVEDRMVEKAIDELHRFEYKGRGLVVKDYSDMQRRTQSSDKPSRDRKRQRDDDFVRREPAPLIQSYGDVPKRKLPQSSEKPNRDRKRQRDNDFNMDSVSKHSGNTYGLSLKFLGSLGIDGPLNTRVFVANLPYDISEEDINELFSICGKVEDVEIVHNDDGKSKGYGFVEFDHPIEAVQAISMLHNQPYHDRRLSVQYTQNEKRSRNTGPRLPSGLKSVGLGLGVGGTPLKDVARTVEAGQQQSLLGALPLNSSPMGINMPLSMNQNFSNNLGHDMSPLMGSNLSDKLMGGQGLMNTPNMRFSNNRHETPINLASSLMGRRNCIQVCNLPLDYTWKSLYDLCQSFGEVAFAKMSGQGVGIVHFDLDSAATRAIDMLDRQEFDGRFLEAKFM